MTTYAEFLESKRRRSHDSGVTIRIGSEGVVALQQRRRFVGVELKPAYWQVARRNLQAAEWAADQPTLFDKRGD